MLQYVVRIGTEVEARFNSVERLLEYTEVQAAGGGTMPLPLCCRRCRGNAEKKKTRWGWGWEGGGALNTRRQHVRTFFTLCTVL